MTSPSGCLKLQQVTAYSVLDSSNKSYQNTELFSIHLKHCYQTPLPGKLTCLSTKDTLINFPELALILLEPFPQIPLDCGKGCDFESNQLKAFYLDNKQFSLDKHFTAPNNNGLKIFSPKYHKMTIWHQSSCSIFCETNGFDYFRV